MKQRKVWAIAAAVLTWLAVFGILLIPALMTPDSVQAHAMAAVSGAAAVLVAVVVYDFVLGEEL